MNDEPVPREDRATAAQAVLNDLSLALDRLAYENRSAVLSQPTYLAPSSEPSLHHLGLRRAALANRPDGTAAEPVAQTGVVNGGEHRHARSAASPPRKGPVDADVQAVPRSSQDGTT